MCQTHYAPLGACFHGQTLHDRRAIIQPKMSFFFFLLMGQCCSVMIIVSVCPHPSFGSSLLLGGAHLLCGNAWAPGVQSAENAPCLWTPLYMGEFFPALAAAGNLHCSYSQEDKQCFTMIKANKCLHMGQLVLSCVSRECDTCCYLQVCASCATFCILGVFLIL